MGIRGSANTGIAATAIIVKDGGVGSVPGGVVYSGRWVAFYLAVCAECGDMVMPFGEEVARDQWVKAHPHEVAIGLEVREP